MKPHLSPPILKSTTTAVVVPIWTGIVRAAQVLISRPTGPHTAVDSGIILLIGSEKRPGSRGQRPGTFDRGRMVRTNNHRQRNHAGVSVGQSTFLVDAFCGFSQTSGVRVSLRLFNSNDR